MPRGGPRVGAGRPKGSRSQSGEVLPVAVEALDPLSAISEKAGETDSKQPLEYMLAVMNDSKVDAGRRDRMAVAAAPYLHPKAGEQGKKDAKAEAAKKVGAGKFAPAAPPSLPSRH